MKHNLANLRRPTLAAAIVSILSVFAGPASGQAGCAPRAQIREVLGARFGETVTAAGVDQSGNLVQVFSSKTGSWTIVVTIPGGPTCLLSAGEGWSLADDRRPPLGSHDS